MSVLDDYLIDPKVSLLTKTRIGTGLVPVLRAKNISVEIHRHNRQALEYRVLVY
jgi:hypothetical protein